MGDRSATEIHNGPLIVINMSGGIVYDVFCSDLQALVVVVDWDVDENDDHPSFVTTSDGDRAGVQGPDPTDNFSNMEGTDVAAALTAAKIDWRQAVSDEKSNK